MVAIIGKTNVGKTFILEKAQSFGYNILNCDLFFEKEYQKGNQCYELIKKNLGFQYVNELSVDKKMIKNLISHIDGRNLLEKLIFPVLFEHLEKNKYDFVEIPILINRNCDFQHFFSKIIKISASFETRLKNLKFKNVDNYDFEFFDTINTGFFDGESVSINMDNLPKNMDWKLFFETHYIKII